MTSEIRRMYFPYCLQKQEDGSWIFLNREYKPVGFKTGGVVDYDDHPVSIELNAQNIKKIRQLSCKGANTDPDRIWLYEDKCAPTTSKRAMSDYLKKLEILLTM